LVDASTTGLDYAPRTTPRFVHRSAGVDAPERDRRSINGEGRPGTQEAETGKAEGDSRRTLGKGNGGIGSLTEEEVSDALRLV
jgi:hypothetical protein